jgi:hypothetical protein
MSAAMVRYEGLAVRGFAYLGTSLAPRFEQDVSCRFEQNFRPGREHRSSKIPFVQQQNILWWGNIGYSKAMKSGVVKQQYLAGLDLVLAALLVLEGDAFEVTALELLAGNFRCLLIEAGEARSVKHLVTSLHAFSERVGRSKRRVGLELRFT